MKKSLDPPPGDPHVAAGPPAETSTSLGLIRSMLAIGSAQAIVIAISLAKMKALALLVGPVGIGFLTILMAVRDTGVTLSSLGLGSSAVREIAASRGDQQTLDRVRRILFAAFFVQGMLALLVVWVLREPLAEALLDDPTQGTAVGLVGVAVVLTLIATAQKALLQGMRRIGDLSKVTVIGTFLGTAAGLAVVFVQGASGLIWVVLLLPVGNMLAGYWYVRKLPRPGKASIPVREIWRIWQPMARLGMAFMLSTLATTATMLLIRSRIATELGLDAAGQFAAAWSITVTYVGFLLTAMGADYYPRLAEVIEDRSATNSLVNDQAQLGLAIGGPVLLSLVGLAPWLVPLLYSTQFDEAVTLLQWQTFGNIFKLASWPLGFAIVAAARGKTYLFTQISFNVMFIAILWPLIIDFGIIVAGPAFSVAYFVLFIVVYFVVRKIHGFRWERLSLVLLVGHAGLSAGLLALAGISALGGAIASIALATITGVLGLRIVLSKIGQGSSLARRASGLFAAINWPIPDRSR